MDSNPPPHHTPDENGHSYSSPFRHSVGHGLGDGFGDRIGDRVDAHALWLEAQSAAQALRGALGVHDIVLPSLGPDHGGPVSGVNLVDLGRVRPDVARALASVIKPRPAR